MAEVYTVHVDSTTPVEITGGRVGHFRIIGASAAFFGGASMTGPEYPDPMPPGAGAGEVTNGLSFPASALFNMYVTSPDEIYAVYNIRQQYEDPGPYVDHEFDLTIFHNR